ncbi:hypothetical protein QAD02_000421 [Eretmocerus hayati]|uniref:Uncharacterized protein n=1 Tax=Eretmocerus hayati TaxID=131215 RepID=A0ACC2NFY8_9HYME|nr:hypothetical protein QAD02_000421 [Eretmocerus hayati]
MRSKALTRLVKDVAECNKIIVGELPILLFALQIKDIGLLKTLLRRGINPNSGSSQGDEQPILSAIAQEDITMVESLLEHGASMTDLEVKLSHLRTKALKPISIARINDGVEMNVPCARNTVDMTAVFMLDCESYNALLDFGAEITAKDLIRRDLLDIVIGSLTCVGANLIKCDEMLNILLDNRGILEEMVQYPYIPTFAVQFGEPSTIQSLLESGLVLREVFEIVDESPMHSAVRNSKATAHYLVDNLLVSVNLTNYLGNPPLHIAATLPE